MTTKSGAKKKGSQDLRREKKVRRKAKEPVDVTRVSTAIYQNINLLAELAELISFGEHQIISRNMNSGK
jgi:hypothetical protein